MNRTLAISALRSSLAAKSVGSAPARGIDDEPDAIVTPAGRLRWQGLHEFFGVADAGAGPTLSPTRPRAKPRAASSRAWTPPICLLAGIACAAVERDPETKVVWIGRRCWPCPLLLDERTDVLAASVFVDPPDASSRLWCVDVAGRCGSRTLVLADGSGLQMAQTRRLQLSAAGGRGVCVLARPPWETGELSAAATRWIVEHEVSGSSRPRWGVSQVRNKDRPALTEDTPRAVVEWNHAGGAFAHADTVGRAPGLVGVPAAVGGGAVREAARGGEASLRRRPA
jgi:hypothetical protein